ncbi:helix-turn-helix domain-containing protein [Enterococcus sp. 669A]|uniref:Helix-turn-helix domain-containing protein n=1 Tax=Candidatus Enterococcus moelleringii TaxID=2815325 RepID=A0ABS3L8I9_9ENTE|nr:helix-turn-helix domain-containing protein [Enterococcus sp. 669A]MBO1305946.1 helix-turn-helix domain-containing protein [Enterococcus sp. 669A]
MKRKIIDTLDRRTRPFTYKELAEALQSSSVTTLQATCKELAELMEQLYPDHSCSLVIQKENHGTTLTFLRSSDNLQVFYDYLYSSDLAYEILQTLLFERQTSTVLFCMDHGLSESSLKRKIKDINRELLDFDLRITCAKQLSLKGPEAKVRAFYYIFLRSVHRQFFTIPGMQNLATDYQLATKLTEYLGVSGDLTLVERFAYWVLITRLAISKGKKLQLSQADLTVMDTLAFPEQPAFLLNWSTQDWNFLLTVVYCSLSENFQLPLKTESSLEAPQQQSWIQLFQAYFRSLTPEEEQLIHTKLNQLAMTVHFFPLSSTFLTTLQAFVGLDELTEMYPLYLQRFEAFWQEWSSQLSRPELEMFRMFSLATCISIMPMDQLLPEIAVYVYSETSDSFKQYLRIKLNFYFSNRYALKFVEIPEAADLLIGTIPFYEDQCSPKQKQLIVRARVSQKDLDNIAECLRELFENQS